MLVQLQTNIHYSFRQVKLLLLALTHSSYSNEVSDMDMAHNERLEFLGDAVLELCISELLYKTFPETREGDLTFWRSHLVNQTALAVLAREIQLDKTLLLGRGEEDQGGRTRDAMLCDALEAVLGAVFLDGGFSEARQVVHTLWGSKLAEVEKLTSGKDKKSLLQELTQKLFQARPVYALKKSLGPEHAKCFVVELSLPDGRIYAAEGPSMKRAEQAAAAAALKDLAPEGDA